MSPACIKFFSFLSYFFLPLTLSIPLLFPFAMILLRDPSSRSFFEMEVNGGGKRMFFSERVSMKSSSKTNQRGRLVEMRDILLKRFASTVIIDVGDF